MAKTPIDILLDKVQYQDVKAPVTNEENLPYVIKQGILKIAGFELSVIILNTGERVIEEESLNKFLENF